MKRFFFISVLVCVFSANAYAANWYVVPSGGSGSGTSWTAAWNGISGINWSSVACGDTIWIAGGTYAGSTITPSKVCTSGAVLTLAAARSDSSACTGAAGWSSSYDTAVKQIVWNEGFFHFTSSASYITFDGRTNAAGGSIFPNGSAVPTTGPPIGWVFNDNNAGDRVFDSESGSPSISHITIEYIYINFGNGQSTTSGGTDNRAFNLLASGDSYIDISHVNLYGGCSGIYSYSANMTLEYSSFHDMNPSDNGVCHVDPVFPITGSNGTVRYSVFYGSNGEGIYFPSFGNGTFNNWEIYGNVFYNLSNSGGSWYSKAIEVEKSISGLKIFNNTFYNNWSNIYLSGSSSCDSTSEIRNNIGSGLSCGSAATSNNISPSSGMFVNLSGNNFNLVSSSSARNAGVSESSYFTADMYNNPYSENGGWDVGAYAYIGAGTSVAPSAPSLLQIIGN
ncbi:MAG TPA: hypothetical protein VLX29_07660 [Nitrospirota bacterium]|nr:hypothetical protein [Nitrospirota bacterium]